MNEPTRFDAHRQRLEQIQKNRQNLGGQGIELAGSWGSALTDINPGGKAASPSREDATVIVLSSEPKVQPSEESVDKNTALVPADTDSSTSPRGRQSKNK